MDSNLVGSPFGDGGSDVSTGLSPRLGLSAGVPECDDAMAVKLLGGGRVLLRNEASPRLLSRVFQKAQTGTSTGTSTRARVLSVSCICAGEYGNDAFLKTVWVLSVLRSDQCKTQEGIPGIDCDAGKGSREASKASKARTTTL